MRKHFLPFLCPDHLLLFLYLTHPGGGALLPDAHRGEDHQAPPEALREAPAGFWVTLRKVN